MTDVPFTEDDFHDLLELETTLDDLVDSRGWQALTEYVQDRLEQQKLRLLGGELANHEDYLKVTWQIRGAEYVLGVRDEVAERVVAYRALMAERESNVA